MMAMEDVTRVVCLVLDSAGVGALPDAARYGDEGSDTLGHVAQRVPLRVPTLRRLGLAQVAAIGGERPAPLGAAGRMAEASAGKDSVTGHWELMGVVLDRAFPTFPEGFPADVIAELERRCGRRVIGNRPASGTGIIDELGAAQLRSGALIVYTSADSVFQIAAHEAVVPVDELYRICAIAFELVAQGLGVGRVIARPFAGAPGAFSRTPRRRDFVLPPPGPTLLDRLAGAGTTAVGIGKIDDLFAGRGLSRAQHSTSDDDGMDLVARELDRTPEGLILANLVDCDTVYGHRNDPAGYAANLERVDARLAGLLTRLAATDLLVITADHGNDPTTASTDHSREYVPLLLAGAAVRPGVDLGTRSSFADLGQTLAELFGVPPLGHGRSFLPEILR
jgi:phosphopentomutase